MSRADEKHGFISANSPTIENPPEADIEFEEAGSSASGCGCFRLCCFGWNQSSQQSNYNLLHQNGTTENREISWVAEKFKEVKEFSEVVAGPKWKNLIRKIGKYCSPKKSRPNQGTSYSPQSYALNFDDGDEEDDDFLMKFSSRISAPPPPTRPSDRQRRGSS